MVERREVLGACLAVASLAGCSMLDRDLNVTDVTVRNHVQDDRVTGRISVYDRDASEQVFEKQFDLNGGATASYDAFEEAGRYRLVIEPSGGETEVFDWSAATDGSPEKNEVVVTFSSDGVVVDRGA